MAIHKGSPRVRSGLPRSRVTNQKGKGGSRVVQQTTTVEGESSGFSVSDSKTLRIFAALLATVLAGMIASRVLQQNPNITRFLSTVPAISANSIDSDSSIIARMKNLMLSQNADKSQTSNILTTSFTQSVYVPTGWKLIRKIRRPNKFFTQGLAFRGDELFESTGIYGESGVFAISLKNETYTVKEQKMIDKSLFGEGLVLWPPYLEKEQSAQALPQYVTGSRHMPRTDDRLLHNDGAPSTPTNGDEDDTEHANMVTQSVSVTNEVESPRKNTADGKHTNEMILQLTWREGIVQILDPVTLDVVDQLAFHSTNAEGWGITTDGLGTFIQSDGSSTLHFWSTDLASAQNTKTIPNNEEGVHFIHSPTLTENGTLAQINYSRAGNSGSRLEVVDAVNPRDLKLQARVSRSVRGRDLPGLGSPQRALNELEFVHGWVFANIWYDNHVAIIHPGTGHIVWYLDFTQLAMENRMYPSDCLNGLAYTMRLDVADPEGAESKIASEPWKGRLWLTGKYWSNIYEVELTDLVLASELTDAVN